MQHLDHGEMAGFSLKQLLLLVFFPSISAITHTCKMMETVPGAATVESFVDPFEALVLVLFDMFARLLSADPFPSSVIYLKCVKSIDFATGESTSICCS